MMVPTIHLNGTSSDELIRRNRAAGDAAYTLLAALDEAWPNARDYYPQGDDAYPKARDEHQSRVERVQSVLNELAALNEAILNSM